MTSQQQDAASDLALDPTPAETGYVEPGGGTGGGPTAAAAAPDPDDSDDDQKITVGTYTISANVVEIVGRTPVPTGLPSTPKPNRIQLLAAGTGLAGTDPGGFVEIRGNDGVRITSGGGLTANPLNPAFSSASTNGVEIAVADAQSVTIARGLPTNLQTVEIRSSLVKVDAGTAEVVVTSKQKVTLNVGGATISMTPTTISLSVGGSTSIVLSASGIELIGAMIQLNPSSPPPIDPPLIPGMPWIVPII